MVQPPHADIQQLTSLLTSRAPLSVPQMAAVMGVSSSAVKNRLARFGPELVKMGATRRICYALRRPLRDLGNQWPIWCIDEHGNAREWVRLEAFHDRLWRVAWPTWAPAWARHLSNPEGMWQGFPLFLADARPQGFLGQVIARNCSRSLQVPEDLAQWVDDDTVAFMHHEGVDLPGNLVFGGDCLQQALARIEVPIRDEEASYGQRAAQAAETMPSASAGGVQPKFAVASLAPDGAIRHLLVKFSPTLDQASGSRWADLLLAEAHALAVLAGVGLALGGTRVLDQGGRRFLELPRFDRTASGGRLGIVSLAALHSAAVGVPHQGWTAAVEA
ncbi:MAG: type toxin-antitoxin system HipA family toxin YjjJ, partial [Verrucomicrobiota bacterium]